MFKHRTKVVAASIAVALAAGTFSLVGAQSAFAAPAALGLTSSSCPSVIQSGQVSGCVTELQNLLNAKTAAGLTVDGNFGPATKTAVLTFQKVWGLTQDGLVGVNTKSALYSAHVLRGAIGAYVKANSASTGYPTTDEYAWAGGVAQAMSKGGYVVWTEATGAHRLSGAIGAVIANSSAQPGFPVTDEYAWNGGAAQQTTNGFVVWTAATGAHWIHGAIGNFIAYYGSQTGFPLTEEYDWNGGRAQQVTTGFVVWTAATGAHWIHGAIGNYIATNGAYTGFPTTEEYAVPGGAAQGVSRLGTLYWNSSTGAITTTPPAAPATSSIAAKAASLAQTRVGASQATIISEYNSRAGTSFGSSTDWCAIFVSDMLRQAGYTGPMSAYAPSFNPNDKDKSSSRNPQVAANFTFIAKGTKPQPGDIALWDWLSGGVRNGITDHVNIVVAASSASSFTVVGGNQGAAAGLNTHVVTQMSSAQEGYDNLLGFARLK